MAPPLERILVALAVACAVVLLLAGLGRRLHPGKAREARAGLRSRVRTTFWLTLGLLAGSTTPARAVGPLPESRPGSLWKSKFPREPSGPLPREGRPARPW